MKRESKEMNFFVFFLYFKSKNLHPVRCGKSIFQKYKSVMNNKTFNDVCGVGGGDDDDDDGGSGDG